MFPVLPKGKGRQGHGQPWLPGKFKASFKFGAREGRLQAGIGMDGKKKKKKSQCHRHRHQGCRFLFILGDRDR